MNPRAKCGVFFCLRARHTSFLYNRGMKHTELFPPFRIEMEEGRPGPDFDREKGMVLTDDMLMALYDGNRLKVVSFSPANCLEGEIEKYVAYLAKDEVPFDLNKAAAYIGPALSFSSFPIDDRTAEAFIETAFGSVKGSEQRRRFIETFRGNPRVDTADTRSGHSPQETGTAKQITLYAHLTSKFIMSFEGNDIASNTRWVMSTNSISVMPRPRRESWFMEGRLIPDYHYIEIKEDFSDLEEKMDYYISHPEKAQEIIDHANAHVRQFHDWRRERFISLLVMKKYFEMTGQLPRTSLW